MSPGAAGGIVRRTLRTIPSEKRKKEVDRAGNSLSARKQRFEEGRLGEGLKSRNVQAACN